MGNLLQHFFLPGPSNNHKSRLLHHKAFLVYILLFVAAQVLMTFVMVNNPQVLGLATDINTKDLLESVNKKRIENGLSLLKIDSDLSKAAFLKAQDMFAKGYWAHFAPDGTTPWSFIDQAGYHYKYAGENLARDFAVSDQVVSAWMNSPTHKKNLLDSRFEDMGLAVVNGKINGEETTLVVQLFGEKTNNIAKIESSTINTTPINNSYSLVAGAVNIKSENATSKNPTVNIFSLTKKLSFGLSLFIIILLYIDARLILKKKVYRISGNNFAHILLFFFLLLALYWSKYGSII